MRTHQWGIAGLVVAVAIAVVGVAVSVAHTARTPSTIAITDFPNEDGDSLPESVAGVVTSPKLKCVRRRTVKIFWIGNSDHPESSVILIDTVRTNRDGHWRGGDVEPIGQGGKVKVLRKNVGRRGHRHICGSDTDVYD